MQRRTPDLADLRCPRCRDETNNHPVRWIEQRHSDKDNVLEGTLACHGCGHRYEVFDGVAALVKDGALDAVNADDPQQSTWLWADYAWELTPLPTGLNAEPPAVDLILPHLTPSHRVVDLGCGAGGSTLAMAAHAGYTLGIELRRGRVEAAQHIRRTGKLTFDLTTVQGHSQPVDVSRPQAPELSSRYDLIVGDALDPPLPPGDWDAVVLGALYDVVREPITLLAQAAALLKPGGLLLCNSPYQFSSQADMRPADPATDLRLTLGSGELGCQFEPVDQAERLWVIRDNHYRFFCYRLDCVLARKL
ncbi:MAG: SAM-dependent methyltransferase [Myxococcota bacterium]|jgi:SAM-dependent methyltransferase